MPSPTPTAAPSAEPAPRQLAAVARMLVLAVWASGWAGAFQFDDFNVIVHYAPVHSWSAWWADLAQGLRPLLKASYTLSWTTGGVLGFHIFNTAIHLTCTALVYVLARRMLRWPGVAAAVPAQAAATVAALLFALHPLQTEAVTYISGRSASFMTLFYLAALLAHDNAKAQPQRAGRWQTLALVAFCAALATKETALTWPLAALLWDMAGRRGEPWGALARRHAPYWVLLALFGLALLGHTRYQRLLAYSVALHTPGDNLLIQVQALSYLLVQWCLPWRSNIDPDIAFATTGLVPWLHLLGWGTLALWAVRAGAKQPLWTFALSWWLLQLLPIYVLVPRADVVNDRQLYLAAWPTLLPAVLLAGQLASRARLRHPLALGVLLALAALNVQRQWDYADEVTLWRSTVLRSPNKARPYNNLGFALAEQGEHAEAEAAYRRALQLDPDYWLAQRNLEELLATTETAR